MSGALLANDGDVQIGVDGATTTVLLSNPRSLPSSTAWAAKDFNPSADIELGTNDTPWWATRGGVRAGYDVPLRRRVEFDVILKGSTPGALGRAEVRDLAAALSWHQAALFDPDEEDELAFQVDGTKYVMYGRYRAVALMNAEHRFALYHARYRVRFEALDPYIYEVATQTSGPFTADQGSSATGVYNTSAVLIDTVGKPTTTAAAGSVASITIGGNAPPRWSITVTGTQLHNPTIYDLRSGYTLWALGTSAGGMTDVTFRIKDRRLISASADVTAVREAWCSGWPTLNPMLSPSQLVLIPRVEATLGAAPIASGPASWSLTWQRSWTGI